MPFKSYPSHTAVILPSVRKAAGVLSQLGFQVGKEDEWDAEGTREIYIESERGNSLLLMEPIKVGPYQRALEKRGPGLHHLAIDVLDLNQFLESISSSGWLLHLSSIKTMKNSKTAYMARPGVPTLIEVQEKKEIKDRPLFVERIEMKFDPKFSRMFDEIGLSKIVTPAEGSLKITIGQQAILLDELL